MGQKINPNLFRLSKDSYTSYWATKKNNYFHLSYEDREIRKFLSNLFANQGIICRQVIISRKGNQLDLEIDLFFSYLFANSSKMRWNKSFISGLKKKYKRLLRIKGSSNFFNFFLGYTYFLKEKNLSYRKQRVFHKNKKAFFIDKPFHFFLRENKKKKAKKSYRLFNLEKGRNKLKKKNVIKKKFLEDLFRLKSFSPDLNKLKKKKRKIRSFKLKKTRSFKSKKSLLSLVSKLSLSLQIFSGVENVRLNFTSLQLKYLPLLRLYLKKITKPLYFYKKNPYFYSSVELVYFILVIFSKNNSQLLGKLLIYLLENDRNQVLTYKFLTKIIKTFFEVLPKGLLSVKGIGFLIKGRFGKRRRSRRVLFQEGDLAPSKLDSSFSFYQGKAVTTLGTFGIKVWINGKEASNLVFKE